jgi:hypothetical protein
MNDQNRINSAWRALIGVALMLAVLRLFLLSTLGPAAVVLAVVGLGWLAYQFLEPLALVVRRAFLREVCKADSGWRRFFWNASILRAGLAFCTLVTAALALMTVDALADYEWTLLVASVPAFGLVFLCVDRCFGPHWQDRHRSRLGMWAAYAITLILLVGAIVAWQIFKVEVPVTTYLAWHEVLTQAFTLKAAEAATPQVGWLLGLNAAASDGAWHLMQTARVEGDSGRWVYWGGCAILLAWSAMKLGSVWLVLLGTMVLASRSCASQAEEPGQGVPNAVFIVVLGLMLFGLPRFAVFDRPASAWRASTVVDTSNWPAPDPCAELRFRQRREVSQRALHELDSQNSELDARMLALVDRRVDVAFAPVEGAVDRFLDWNFSIEGQYAQLAYLAASAASSSTFDGYIASQVDSHVYAVLDPALAQVGEAARLEMARAIEAAYRSQDVLVTRLVEEASCLEVPQPTIRLEDYMQKSLVGAGVGAGTIGTRLANRVGGRMVARNAMKRAMTAVATKGATRTASAAKGGLAGLACGPYAPFCIVGFAAVAWFGTDVVINTIDEALHREDMRAEMLGVLETEKGALKQQLRAAYLEVSAQAFEELREYQAARFNIYRDGG